MKLMIAVPCHDSLCVPFVKSLMALTDKLRKDGVDYSVNFKSGTLVYLAREELAMEAVVNRFDYVLWLDSDMVFPDTFFNDLYETGKSFVCGAFRARRYPYAYALFHDLYKERVETLPDGLFAVDGCGFAGTLTREDVIRTVLSGKDYHCFLPTAEFGEDLAFCRRAREKGIEIWCNPKAKMGHIGQIEVWSDKYPNY